MKLLQWYSSSKVQYLIGISIIIAFTIAYILLLLNRYWQFEYFSVDNVYFDTALWKMAHFQVPMVRHQILGEIPIFGDHFHPMIFLFSILYMFTAQKEIIFIGMSVVYGLSGVIAMLIGFKVLKSKLITYALLVAYFLYVGTQHAMIYGFHEINLTPLFFMLVIYTIVFERWRWYWVSLLGLLLVKESMVFITFTIGFFVLWAIPGRRKEGIITMILSIVYLWLVTKVVIPYFSQQYLYNQIDWPNDFPDLIKHLTDPKEKIETFVVSNATFAFLPLMNIFTLPIVLQDFFVRYIFAIPGTVQYTLTYHYNIALVPILFFSSLWTIKILQNRNIFGKFLPAVAIIILMTSFYFHRLYGQRGPLLLVINKAFYESTKTNAFLWELVNKTPKTGKIMTQNHLAYIYAHQDVYLMNDKPGELEKINPDYIVYDLREGQNPNNYFPLDEERMKKFSKSLLESGKYTVYFNKGTMYILKKK